MTDLPVQDLISVTQAIQILDNEPLTPLITTRSLQEALGLILAEELSADRDYPPFDKAVMDGFAVCSADVVASGVSLKIIDTIAAGSVSNTHIGRGEAMAIMTGAPLPPGADTVIPVEWTQRVGSAVTIDRPAKAENAIARRGVDSPQGQSLLTPGTRVGPAQIAVAATIGRSHLRVYQPPSVALISTGDELIDIDQSPTGSQIRNSNRPMLFSLLQRLGCQVEDLGLIKDDPAQIKTAIERGLQTDAVFIAGGMSMGERDYVPEIFSELNLKPKISKLRIKPGKPFVFAVGEREQSDLRPNPPMAFGLPGNPVSAFLCTLRLANRILQRLAGTTTRQLQRFPLAASVPSNGNRELYLPARLRDGTVSPLSPTGSADIFTLALADGFLVRPENAPAAIAGQFADFLAVP